MLKGLRIYPPNSGTAEKKKFSNSLLSLFHQRFLAIPGVTMRKVTIGVSGQNVFSTIRRACIYIEETAQQRGVPAGLPTPGAQAGQGTQADAAMSGPIQSTETCRAVRPAQPLGRAAASRHGFHGSPRLAPSFGRRCFRPLLPTGRFPSLPFCSPPVWRLRAASPAGEMARYFLPTLFTNPLQNDMVSPKHIDRHWELYYNTFH